MPESDFQILHLTDEFYNDYPGSEYKEILKKKNRAYNCLLFESNYDYFICIPFRTEISHLYSFRFKKSHRSKLHQSGLDYTKIVIIKNSRYLDSKDAIIDKDEFHEMIVNIEKIKKEALDFVDSYVKHIEKIELLHEKEFQRRYSFSPLKYFHKELGCK